LEIFREKQKLKKRRNSAKVNVRFIPSNIQKELLTIDINKFTPYVKVEKKKRDLNETRYWRLYYRDIIDQPLYPSKVHIEGRTVFFTSYGPRKDYSSILIF
jgi:putative cell wall-binding protein